MSRLFLLYTQGYTGYSLYKLRRFMKIQIHCKFLQACYRLAIGIYSVGIASQAPQTKDHRLYYVFYFIFRYFCYFLDYNTFIKLFVLAQETLYFVYHFVPTNSFFIKVGGFHHIDRRKRSATLVHYCKSLFQKISKSRYLKDRT